jgi:hypothetical protein
VAALVLIPLPDPAMTAEDSKALFFARCASERLNPADFRLGAMVDDDAGTSLLVASSDAKIVECAASPGSVSSVVADMSIAQMRPNLIRALSGVGSADAKRFLGYGRVSLEVTAVEFILPDGRTMVATVVGETFAYSAPYYWSRATVSTW